MSHRNARLTVHGRRLLVERVPAHKWVRRWRAEGEQGLHDLLDRPTGQVIRRYERDRPGEIAHVEPRAANRPAPTVR